ncbi:MAG TPA: Zn-dependent hydrolase [Aestuariivirga sp.]|nr:Zn-dependent hydrolase [Aestuariivirga sp.]
MTHPVLDPDLLHCLMDGISAVAATPEGGVNRPALTPEDGQARAWLRQRFDDLGMRTVIDPIGNMFGILNLAGWDAPCVMTGSHLDSQPFGGRFDGAYGVVAGLAAAAAIREAHATGGFKPTANLVVCNWTNEEGARFQPSLIGSSVYDGSMALADAYAVKDGKGISVHSALGAIGYLGQGVAPRPRAYIEMHVECAPELERSGKTIGPFAGYWGATKIRAAVRGMQSHTGPTPMERRRDALLGAAYVMTELRALVDRAADVLHTSVGRIEAYPNSPNSVCSDIIMFVELRARNQTVLEWAEMEFGAIMDSAPAKAKTAGEILDIEYRRAGDFDKGLLDLVERVSAEQGFETMRLHTVAAHDGIRMTNVCPSIVVAIKSIGGICHNATEYSEPRDVEAGASVLLGSLWSLLLT